MKKFGLLSALIVLWLSFPFQAYAEDGRTISHVVLVWLKEPGNQKMRRDFVAASEKLNSLPGIISRHVGIVVPSDRGIVDDTFDVAITVTLKNRQALEAYMQNPIHKNVVEKQLKPLVNRIVAYDFISE